MSDKKLYSFRLTRDASDAINALTEHMGINRTSVIEVIARQAAKDIPARQSAPDGMPVTVGDLFTVEDGG